MNETSLPRRIALRQLASLGFFGALGVLHARSAPAAPSSKPAGTLQGVKGTIVRRADANHEE